MGVLVWPVRYSRAGEPTLSLESITLFENWRGSSMNVTAVLDRYHIGEDVDSTSRSPTMLKTRPTPTDNRQRWSGCERTNGNYLNYSNRPKQLAKQSACACISTEPHPGNSENHEVQPRHFLANRSGVVLALATLHCPTEWRSSSSGRKHLLRQNGEVLYAKPPST
jgi:hypothetical protein